MTKRDKFQTRTIILAGESQRDLAIAMIKSAPLGIEIVAREPVKARKQDQNALMWVGPLSDIANQAWVNGRQYSAEVWHEMFKREFLPDDSEFPTEFMTAELVKNPDKYKKWDFTATNDRICIASTTDLTVKGFSLYLEQIYAYGANLGVMFSASRNVS